MRFRAALKDSGDNRLSRRSTIMGLAGLTAVFGMGTGVTPPVWSPENRPDGRSGHAGRDSAVFGHVRHPSDQAGWHDTPKDISHWRYPRIPGRFGAVAALGVDRESVTFPTAHWRRAADRGGQALGCWDRSAAAVARRALPAYRPGRLPGAFAANAAGNLVLEGASRLDAFSAYPVPTWLPGDAPSGTAGTPEVGPPQSSRTRGDPPQVSYAHGR